MRIQQLYVSPGMSNFEDRWRKKYNLLEYTDNTKPAIFYGFFTAAPPVVAAHKSVGVILWAGTDALRIVSLKRGKKIPNQHAVEKVLKMKNVYHICRSEYIRKDFELCGVSYKFVRVSPTDPSLFHPVKLGPCIYCYGHKYKPEKYGGEEVRKLREMFPDIKFLSNDMASNLIPYEEMPSVYAQCFLGLRLTTHDGLPNSVLEMALMGRRSVYNGDLPGSIHYGSFNDVVKSVREERERVGFGGDESISEETRKMLDIPDDWLHTSFYQS